MPEFSTPPQIADRMQTTPENVIDFIRAGELRAINISKGNRPRYRVSEADFLDFLEKRAVRPKQTPAPKQQPSRTRKPAGFIEYV